MRKHTTTPLRDLQPVVKMRLQSKQRGPESLTDETVRAFRSMSPRQIRRLERAQKFNRDIRRAGIETARAYQNNRAELAIKSFDTAALRHCRALGVVIGADLGAATPSAQRRLDINSRLLGRALADKRHLTGSDAPEILTARAEAWRKKILQDDNTPRI